MLDKYADTIQRALYTRNNMLCHCFDCFLYSLKVYFNEGNCVRLCIPEVDLDETPEIIQRLSVVTNGTRVGVYNLCCCPLF